MDRVYVSDTNIWIDFRNAGLLDDLFRLPFSMTVHGALWLLDQLLALEVVDRRGLAVALDTMLIAGSRLPSDECHRRLKEWMV
jgi:hypothetical protein